MRAVRRIISGCSVDKIIIILSVRVGVYKNTNIGHRGKEACANKSKHISFPCDSTVSNALNFCFLYILLHPKRKRSY